MNKNIHTQKDLNGPESTQNDTSSMFAIYAQLTCVFTNSRTCAIKELKNVQDLPLKW